MSEWGKLEIMERASDCFQTLGLHTLRFLACWGRGGDQVDSSGLEARTHVEGGFRGKGALSPANAAQPANPDWASWKVTSRWSPRWAGVFYEILRAEVDYVPGMRGLCHSPRGPLL